MKAEGKRKLASSREALWSAITAWLRQLESYPGWKEWKRSQLGYTLLHDDDFFQETHTRLGDFEFPKETEKQHDLLMRYFAILDTALALAECEFYFRRYPFRGLPVSRHNHIKNVCEMYFGRFYEFKERLKLFFKALKAACPEHRIEAGKLIKIFEKEFEHELRERNAVHHRERFEDVAIKKLFLTHSMVDGEDGVLWRREHDAAYRRFTREWVQRVKRRSRRIEEYVEAIAKVTLDICPFLALPAEAPTSAPPR